MPKVFFGISVILIVIQAVVSNIKEQRLNAEVHRVTSENAELQKEISDLQLKLEQGKDLPGEIARLKKESGLKDKAYENLKKISAEQADEIAALGRENDSYAERLRQMSHSPDSSGSEKNASGSDTLPQ